MFKKRRKELGVSDAEEFLVSSFFMSDGTSPLEGMACAIELPMPDEASDWRRLKRSPDAFYAKKIKGAELQWHLLTVDQKKELEVAKQAEVSQWFSAAAVRRVVGPIPTGRTVRSGS